MIRVHRSRSQSAGDKITSGTLRFGIAVLFAVTAAFGQDDGPTLNAPRNAPVGDLLNMKGVDRPSALTGVTIEQRLNSQLPLDAIFKDEYGQKVQLGKYFGKRPVVLALVYYECPMLCTQILNGMVRAAKVMTFTPGKDYDVVAISFDARETPKEALLKKKV
jgi:protein SCO1/2